jgi:nicotinamide phosphoribosyltransferase
LNPAVRVIQGDGIDDENSIDLILSKLTDAGYSADNVAFGMGGGLLQQVNRDNLKFAMKCSAIKQNGEWKDVYKCPVDAPWKASKGGRFDNDRNLEVIWENGRFIKEYTFDEVRNNENC